jgi:hypothetical protein
MSEFIKLVSAISGESDDPAVVAQASACLDRFTAEFNACNLAGIDRELHFPHLMLSGAERLEWRTAGQHPEDFFAKMRSTGWSYTQYESKEAILASPDKVHFVVTYTRRNKQGQILSTHRNLWVVTRIAAKWGIVLRSY